MEVCVRYLAREDLGRGTCSGGSDTVVSVPSADSVPSVDSESSEEFCCSRNRRKGQSGRRAFVKLRGGEGWEEIKFFCKTNPFQNFRYPANQLHIKEILDLQGIGAMASFWV